jgi:hypothetical protein
LAPTRKAAVGGRTASRAHQGFSQAFGGWAQSGADAPVFLRGAIMLDLTLSDYLTRDGVPGTLRQSWEHGAWPGPNQQTPLDHTAGTADAASGGPQGRGPNEHH